MNNRYKQFNTSLISGLLCLLLMSCSKSSVTHSATSLDGKWKADIIALDRRVGVIDVEVIITRHGKVAYRKHLGTEEALIDVTNSIRGLLITDSRIIVTTRGKLGQSPTEITLQDLEMNSTHQPVQ